MALPAPAARRSATCAASEPLSPNWVSAVTVYPAASATARPPAAARSSDPARPPPRIWSADRPAFASSSIAPAASVAENAVSAPASIAATRSASIDPRASSPVEATPDIASSKSANFFTARSANPVIAAPATPKPRDRVLIAWSFCDAQSRLAFAASFVACPRVFIWFTAPETFALMFQVIVLSATARPPRCGSMGG